MTECIELHKGDCRGAVTARPSLTGTGTPIERCDAHWEARLAVEDVNAHESGRDVSFSLSRARNAIRVEDTLEVVSVQGEGTRAILEAETVWKCGQGVFDQEGAPPVRANSEQVCVATARPGTVFSRTRPTDPWTPREEL